MGSSQLDKLIACFKALDTEGQRELLAEAERLERRARTKAILQHVAKQKKGNRGDDVEMGFDDLLTFVRGLPVDESHAVRIWGALAIKAGKMKDIRGSSRLSELRKLRFTVGLIHRAVRDGVEFLGNSVGPEIFEILEGWDKTL